MANVIREPVHTGEFLLSEANGHRSRSQVTLARHSQTYASGTVLAQIDASHIFARHTPGAEDGTGTARAVLYAAVDATEGDRPAVVIDADAEVNGQLLAWAEGITGAEQAAAIADLKTAGIKVR